MPVYVTGPPGITAPTGHSATTEIAGVVRIEQDVATEFATVTPQRLVALTLVTLTEAQLVGAR